MSGIDFSGLDRPGIDSVMFAVKNLLEECDGREFHLKAKTFCKIVKGKDVRDTRFEMSIEEQRRYKRQLARVLKYWDEYEMSGDWTVEESNGMEFKLVFRRDNI